MVVCHVHGSPREYVGGSDQAGEPHRVAEGLGRLEAGQLQVWSLTQFYSVDYSKSRIDVKKCVFNKRTRFASVVVDGVLGPPRLARHT